jgi:methyltransferase-like protein
MPLDAVIAAAGSRLGRGLTADEHREIRSLVIGGFQVGAVELHTWQPETGDGASLLPEASPIVRYELTYGSEVTTLWHERLVLGSDASRQLLAALDGRHDRKQIIDQLTRRLSTDEATPPGGQPTSQWQLRAEIAEKIDAAITDLARAAVLIR